MIMRTKLYEIIEPATDNLLSKIYDFFMMTVIIVSITPLVFKETNEVLNILEYITVSIFLLDYLLRWITADLKLNKSVLSFFVLFCFRYRYLTVTTSLAS